MAHCTDAFSSGWNRMMKLAFQPVRGAFWLKGVLLLFLMQAMQYCNPSFLYGDLIREHREADQLAEALIQRLPYMLAGLVMFMLLGIVLGFLSSAARIIFYQGVQRGTFQIRGDFARHIGSIISFFLWNICIIILAFIAAMLVGGVLVGIMMLLGAGSNGVGIGFMLLVLIGLVIGLGLFVLSTLYVVLLDGVVIPQMVIEETGILAAWGRALSLLTEHLFEFIGFIVIRFVIGFIMGLIIFVCYFVMSIFIMLIVAGGSGFDPSSFAGISQSINSFLMAPLMLVLTAFLFPFPLLSDAYSLYFMRAITGDSRYQPPNEQDGGGAQQPAGPAPEPPFSPAPPRPPMEPAAQTGPVHFNDIPVEAGAPVQAASPAPETPAPDFSPSVTGPIDETPLEPAPEPSSSPERPIPPTVEAPPCDEDTPAPPEPPKAQ